jgi:hypothetical protein
MNDLPCKTCPSMAICNAQIPIEDDPNAIDTFLIYRDCSIMRDYFDTQFKSYDADPHLWTKLLNPMKEYFNAVKRSHAV